MQTNPSKISTAWLISGLFVYVASKVHHSSRVDDLRKRLENGGNDALADPCLNGRIELTPCGIIWSRQGK